MDVIRDFIDGVRAGAYSDDERVYIPVIHALCLAVLIGAGVQLA